MNGTCSARTVLILFGLAMFLWYGFLRWFVFAGLGDFDWLSVSIMWAFANILSIPLIICKVALIGSNKIMKKGSYYLIELLNTAMIAWSVYWVLVVMIDFKAEPTLENLFWVFMVSAYCLWYALCLGYTLMMPASPAYVTIERFCNSLSDDKLSGVIFTRKK